MPHALVEASTFSASVVVPNPGELVKAADVEVACQALANRTKYLKDRLLFGTVALPILQLDDVGTVRETFTGVSSTVSVEARILVEDCLVGDVLWADVQWVFTPNLSGPGDTIFSLVTEENGGGFVVRAEQRRDGAVLKESISMPLRHIITVAGDCAIALRVNIQQAGDVVELNGCYLRARHERPI